jgi:predicted dehydrogenase
MRGVPYEARERVRVGLVGCGRRGHDHLGDLLGIDKVEVRAVCDSAPAHAASAQALCEKRKAPRPEAYTNGERDYERLVARDDLDLVYFATPWRWHVPMAVAAMEAGKHVALEIPAALTLEDCWKLVEVSERTRRHCTMLENCNYGYEEMLVNRMVQAGLFGDLLHAECAYDHDLRTIVFEGASEGLWRRAEHIGRNGNLYPTHGLGPVAWYLGIDKGDRFDHLVSMSSPEAGLSAHRKATVPAGDPRWQEKYDCGDVNTSLIKTALGRTIVLQHNVTNPRPYDRINLVAGTKGIFRGYPQRIFFDGGRPPHKWESLKKWRSRYEDPLWTKLKKAANKSGHGGMDYVMSWRLVDCLRRGLAPDMDVYDAAAWSAPGPLSEASVAAGSAPVKFPDFTRGRWKGATSSRTA